MTDVSRHHFKLSAIVGRLHVLLAAAVLGALVVLSGCSKRIPGPAAPATTLHVENQGFLDVNVFVMRSPGSRGLRLGTVNGNSSRTFRVRLSDLQGGGQMVLQVRAISGRSTWTSPTLSVDIGTVARLDVISSGGDLSRSQLYRQ